MGDLLAEAIWGRAGCGGLNAGKWLSRSIRFDRVQIS